MLNPAGVLKRMILDNRPIYLSAAAGHELHSCTLHFQALLMHFWVHLNWNSLAHLYTSCAERGQLLRACTDMQPLQPYSSIVQGLSVPIMSP